MTSGYGSGQQLYVIEHIRYRSFACPLQCAIHGAVSRNPRAVTLFNLTLVINFQNDSEHYIVKCFYLCASAAVFDNKVLQAKNQLRKIQK